MNPTFQKPRAVACAGRGQSFPRGRVLTMIALTVMVLAAHAPAAAQTTDPRDRLSAELDRTDRILEQAREVVADSESERARTIREKAVELQEMARKLFEDCDRDHLTACEGAARATTRARREAFHAIRIAREQSSHEHQAARTIERAAHLLDEARAEVAGEDLSPRTEALLDEARAQLERARERHQARQFAVALELAQTAERLLREALGLGGRGEVNPERVRRELERTDRLIERASPTVHESGNAEAIRVLDRSVEMQARAHAQFGRERPLMALRLTRDARELVHRALRLGEGPVNQDAVERGLRQTDQLIERVEPVVRASGDEQAIRLLEAGLRHQERARAFFKEERLRAALAQTRVARNLVLEAGQRAESE